MADMPLPGGTVFVGGYLELGVDGLANAPFTTLLRQVLRERGRGVFEPAADGGVGELARILPELGAIPTERPESRGVLFDQVPALSGAPTRCACCHQSWNACPR